MNEKLPIKALVIDNGLFLPLALKLGEQYEAVYYWTPTEKGFPTLNDAIIGQGFDQIIRCRDIWRVIPEVDLVVFPDIQHAGLQLHLEKMGKPVWGSRAGDELELSRMVFLRLLEKLELDHTSWKIAHGLTELSDLLRDAQDKYVKISRYRGSMETWHWRSWKADEGMLDELAVRFGPAKNMMPFLVLDAIDADVEVGYDGFSIDGKFPHTCGIQGYESKDRAFLCRAQDYDTLPEPVRRINAAFAEFLGEHRYRNFWSTEIRVSGDQAFFIDPCCRCPSPSTECQLALYENLGEIIWSGAMGHLIEPVLTAQFAASAVMTVKDDRKDWVAVEFPEQLMPHLACGNCCLIEDKLCFPPGQDAGPEIGWIVATGNDVSSTIETLKDLAADVPEGVDVHLAELADLIRELEAAEDEGIKFSKNLPDPSIVSE